MTFFRCPACNSCMKINTLHDLKFCLLCGFPLDYQNEKKTFEINQNKKNKDIKKKDLL